MNRTTTATVFAILLAICAAQAHAAADPCAGRRLVWGDEFDGKTLDSSKWGFRQTMHGADCVYVNDSRTVRLEDGCLHLLVIPSGDPGHPWMLPQGVTTHEGMGFKYGYLEMRGRVPFRHGAWPSFWLTSTFRFRDAPYEAEIDIFESFSSTNAVVYNLHKWTTDGKRAMLPNGEGHASRSFTFPKAETLNNEFHVYGFEWTPAEMSFWIDGEKYASVPVDEAHDFSPDGFPGMGCFHDFQSVIFNNEIFSPCRHWCPDKYRLSPDESLPIDYWIDWVRLWQKDGEEICFPTREKDATNSAS